MSANPTRKRRAYVSRMISHDKPRNLLHSLQYLTLLDLRRKAVFDADDAMIREAKWLNPDKIHSWGRRRNRFSS